MMDFESFGMQILETLIYGVVGVVAMMICTFIMMFLIIFIIRENMKI